ncbi:hypothetical protein JN12_01315 [Geobacter argillaceus]|uniref:Uncharacterized protein n=1 Tax=Geobacter argillaceus TaxID=345631 RepID=A0A562VPA0_9BACT|nr:hypothetical protein JN12_01315 [Geobacter argillaceus]
MQFSTCKPLSKKGGGKIWQRVTNKIINKMATNCINFTGGDSHLIEGSAVEKFFTTKSRELIRRKSLVSRQMADLNLAPNVQEDMMEVAIVVASPIIETYL